MKNDAFFTVRHSGYKQYPGYAYFMRHVLNNLNDSSPKTPDALFNTASNLLANEQESVWDQEKEEFTCFTKNHDVLLNCLPHDMRTKLELKELSYEDCFGPIMSMGYGKICLPDPDTHGRNASVVITPFLIRRDDGSLAQYRGYWERFRSYYNLDKDSIAADTKLDFSYPLPTPYPPLQLMQIGTPKALRAAYLSRFSNPSSMENEYENISRTPEGSVELLFLHPPYNIKYQKSLIQHCINPRWTILTSTEPSTATIDDKINAAIEIYWFIAQSTPPERGGSAFSNVILAHMIDRLRDQGLNVPLDKNPNIDLWAEAALLPLADTANIRGFRSLCREAIFAKNAPVSSWITKTIRAADQVPYL